MTAKFVLKEHHNMALYCGVKSISISRTDNVNHEYDRQTDILLANAALNCVAQPKTSSNRLKTEQDKVYQLVTDPTL